MTENPAETAATAVAEPPAPPDAPPATATGSAPAPKRKRWVGWVVGILSAVIVIGALVGVVVWALRDDGTSSADFSVYRTPFESAMAKAGTTSEFPGAPVDISAVTATGSHAFEATFTAAEITALLNVFASTKDIDGTSVAVSGISVDFPSAGNVALQARATVNGSTYGGSIQGPAEYQAGRITSSGATKATAEGFGVPADRAKQATELLLVYLNAYLTAAPGLKVDSATITSDGLRVSGTAPDSLTMP